MALRFYIVPLIQTGNVRVLAHFGGRYGAPDAQLVGVKWWPKDYGLINTALVLADVSPSQAAYLSALGDIQPIPATITSTITAGQVAAIRAKLEGFNIPGSWVNVGDSYQAIMREIAGYFEFMQALTGITGVNPIGLNINLETVYSDLPQRWQLAILEAAAILKLSTSGLTGSSTLRQILRNVASQNGQREFKIGETTF